MPPSFVGIGGCNDGFFVTNNFNLAPVNSGDGTGDGEVFLTDDGAPLPSGLVDVVLSSPTDGAVNAAFNYTVGYFGSDPNIASISLTLDKVSGTGAVTKYIYDGPDEVNLVASLTLDSPGTVSINVPAPPSFGFYIKDVYSGSGINGFQNAYHTYQSPASVPGPLPVLGAGVAFRFSRKLRKRIGTRQAG